MVLKNPKKYKGYSKHPLEDNTIRQVIKATILPSNTTGFDLRILFEDGVKLYDWSPTIIGAKQIFAFHIETGAKWE